MVQLGRVTKQRHTLIKTAQLVVGNLPTQLVAIGTPQVMTLGALPPGQLGTRTLQQVDIRHWRNMKIRRKRVKKWKISTKANTLGRKRAIRKVAVVAQRHW